MHHFRFNLRRHHHVFQGFTLIELLVVMSIIGVLSTVVFAGIQTARERGRVAAGIKFEGYTYRAYYDDVVASWDFESVNGTQVADSSINNNHLILSGATMDTDTPNNFGRSLKLAINSDHEARPPATLVNSPTDSFSVSLWFKTSETIEPYKIISNTYPPLATGKWYIGIQDDSKIVGVIRTNSTLTGGGTARDVKGPVVSWNKWMHVVLTCSVNVMALYVDGKVYGTFTFPSTPPPHVCLYLNSQVKIGNSEASVPSAPILNVDNVRIYKKALPTASIQEIYLAEKDEFLPVAER